MLNLFIIMATLLAKEGGNERSAGGFSEYKSETFHPQTHAKPAAGEPFSENKTGKGESQAVENPNTLKQQAQQYQQKTQPTPSTPTTPATPTGPTPAQVAQTLQQANPQMGNWFGANWWNNHNLNPYLNPAANWWAGANWANASQWAGAAVAAPVYYDPNGTITPVTQPTTTTTNTAETKPVDNWIPLGVFAIGTQDVDPSNATTFVQLAVDNQGKVAGTYYDSTTDKAQHIKGNYDKTTQEISWKIAGMPDSPIMQTGLYNLTQDETPIKVIMPDTSKQTWSLVKIKK